MNWKLIRYVDRFVGIPLVCLIFYVKKLLNRFHHTAEPHEYKRILLIKFWGIGNTLMLLPAAAALKKRYPRCRLAFLTLRSNKEAAQSAQLFDDIYCIDTRSPSTFLLEMLTVLSKVRKINFDVVIDFEQFARISTLLCTLIAKKKTIGLKTHGQHRHLVYTTPVLYDNTIHMTKTFYNLVEYCGIPHRDTIEPVPLQCKEDDLRHAQEILQALKGASRSPIVIIHVGTSKNFNLRRWPPRNFACLADILIEKQSAKIILTAMGEEKILAQAAYAHLKHKNSVINAASTLTFGQFVALIKNSALVISADTATVHIASCCSVPTVGLYGPNTPLLYGPWGENDIWLYKNLACSPCITNYNSKINRCAHPQGKGACMRMISAEEVYAEIEKTYFSNNAHSSPTHTSCS